MASILPVRYSDVSLKSSVPITSAGSGLYFLDVPSLLWEALLALELLILACSLLVVVLLEWDLVFWLVLVCLLTAN